MVPASNSNPNHSEDFPPKHRRPWLVRIGDFTRQTRLGDHINIVALLDGPEVAPFFLKQKCCTNPGTGVKEFLSVEVVKTIGKVVK